MISPVGPLKLRRGSFCVVVLLLCSSDKATWGLFSLGEETKFVVSLFMVKYSDFRIFQ